MLDLKNEKLLVLAPHPDDEVFGCGGLIHRIKQAGGQAYVRYLSVGTTKDFSKQGRSTTAQRQDEIERVAALLRFDGYDVALPHKHHLCLDALPQKELINVIEREGPLSLQELRPTLLAFPSRDDYNQDHRAVHDAAIAATRPVPPIFKHTPRTILQYEMPYFGYAPEPRTTAPNFFLALDTKALRMKLKALRLYKSQMKVKKGPVSVYAAEVLAQMRGIQCGADAAEAFYLRRGVL